MPPKTPRKRTAPQDPSPETVAVANSSDLEHIVLEEESSQSVGAGEPANSDSENEEQTPSDRTPSESTEDDPVVAEYEVYITAPASAQAQADNEDDPTPLFQPADAPLYLLQYLNRAANQPYNTSSSMKPTQLRIKPQSGFVEVEVPIPVTSSFDHDRAAKWGEALRKSNNAENLGLAGGFVGRRGRAGFAPKGENAQASISSGGELQSQTLGGLVLPHNDTADAPNYLIGTFEGSSLHLTPVAGVVQLRPQFRHLDAEMVVTRQRRIPGTSKGRGRRRSGSGGGDENAREQMRELKAVPMPLPLRTGATRGGRGGRGITVGTGDDIFAATRLALAKAAEEEWVACEYNDEDSEIAHAEFQQRLFLNSDDQNADLPADAAPSADSLLSAWSKERYLQAIVGSLGGAGAAGRPRQRPKHNQTATSSQSSGVTTNARDTSSKGKGRKETG